VRGEHGGEDEDVLPSLVDADGVSYALDGSLDGSSHALDGSSSFADGRFGSRGGSERCRSNRASAVATWRCSSAIDSEA